MDYPTALEHLLSLADFERSVNSPSHSSFHLDRISLILEKLGNPHLGIPTVHVAGSKGKGSTAALIASALAAQGYQTGLYTSPHIHSFCERIRVGGKPLAREEFAALVAELWPLVDRVGREGGYGEVTTFEMLTAMAFHHFRLLKADVQVVEVGLGGRLDTTNVVRPDVCVLTSISLDHVSILGNTVDSIAREKAGIIKPGAVVVVAPQTPEALGVFQEASATAGCRMINVAEEMSWTRGSWSPEGQSFTLRSRGSSYDLWIPLLGTYQLENAATAVSVLEELKQRGLPISREGIEAGFREVQWPARLEVLVHNGKTVVVDGAHNPYSMSRLVESLGQYFQFRRLVLVFGATEGHNAEGMVAELASLSPVTILGRSRHPRASDNAYLRKLFAQHNVPVIMEAEDVGTATRYALEIAQEGDLILGTGSLFVAAEVREVVKGIPSEIYSSLQRTPKQRRSLV